MTPEPLLPGMRPQWDADVEAMARAIFCQRCDIAQVDLDSCLVGNPILACEFDALMDEIAADSLIDDKADFEPRAVRLSAWRYLHMLALDFMPESGVNLPAAYQITREYVADLELQATLRCALRGRYHAALGDGAMTEAMHIWCVLTEAKEFQPEISVSVYGEGLGFDEPPIGDEDTQRDLVFEELSE